MKTSFLVLLVVIFVAIAAVVFSRDKSKIKGHRSESSSPIEITQKDELNTCAWLPWWDYQNAVDNLETFDIKVVTPFTFILDEELNIDSKTDIEDLVALKKGYTVIPSIYNDFDGERVSKIINSKALTDTHINELIELVNDNDFTGLELDYEYLLEEDREAYSSFVEQIATELHAENKKLIVTVHPKTSEKGEWYAAAAQDWERIGNSADQVRIMTYDFHWESSDAGPIAPIDWFTEVLDFAGTKLERDKVAVGLGHYGYDWTEGGEKARALTLQQIENLIGDVKPEILLDEESQSPTFNYEDDTGKRHSVWFENVDSISTKRQAVLNNGFSNVCIWRLGGIASEYAKI